MSLKYSLLPLAIAALLLGLSEAQLRVGYYQYSCPQAEAIVRQELTDILTRVPSLAAPLLRLHFHDCFVNGCDASVLLDLDQTGGDRTEKNAPPNRSLRGFGVIDRIKSKLEKACPGVVSCADILALAARDAVALSNGPSWNVPTGRRDGSISSESDALAKLPKSSSGVSEMLEHSFRPIGLDINDLIVLSGAHTIGTAHCPSFSDRLYNVNGTDPHLDANYAARLRSACKQPDDPTTIVEMDPGSYKTFDTKYYKNILKRRGLFTSDQSLLNDDRTRDYVVRLANGPKTEFFNDFAASMIKMGNVGVLTGNQGEIRKQCHAKN